MPSERLVTSGIGSGIPPVMRIVPAPTSVMAGPRCVAAVMAPTTFTAHASRCARAVELAEDVRLDQRRVVDEDLGHAEAVDRLVERRAQPRLVGHVDREPEGLDRCAVEGGEGAVDGTARAGED